MSTWGTWYAIVKVGSKKYKMVTIDGEYLYNYSYGADMDGVIEYLDETYSNWIEAYETIGEAHAAMQALMNGATGSQPSPPPGKTDPAQKPVGSTAPSIVEAKDKGTYTLLKMDDGSYGYYVPSNGYSKFGISTPAAAGASAMSVVKKGAAQQLAAMGVDPGSNAVDTLLNAYETRMRDMYGQAANEMARKQAEYLAKFEERRGDMLGRVANGTMTQDEYDAWLRGQTSTNQWYGEMVRSLSQDLVEADTRAMQMLNGYVPKAYAENMNYSTFQIEEGASLDTAFSLYNKHTVARLISNQEGSLLPDLPQPKVDQLKDTQWSRRKINSAVTQSILQGESVAAAAKRLMSVVGMSANSAMRAARTALTGAQNLGRMDAGRRAKEMGIELRKQWIATVDSRTRYSHREIDRETAELEDTFSNGCECPGDPSGPGEEVYNCRCAMRFVMPGHEYDDLPETTKEGIAYDEWKNERQTKLEAKKESLLQKLDELTAQEGQIKASMPENQTYSGIWKNDVTLDDWKAKQGSIGAKEDYYLNRILNAPNTPAGDAMVKEAKQRLLQLSEFQTKGAQYTEAKKAVSEQLSAIAELKKKATTQLARLGISNAYSDERKASAYRWSSEREADRVLRRYTEDAWKAATASERRAIYNYTSGSGKFNRPLSGFEGSWSPSYYRGVGNVDLNYEGGKRDIQNMTRFIQRSTFDEDVWVRRGCGTEAMESFFELDFGRMRNMSDDELQRFVGHSNRIAGFLSCGTAAEGGSGFGGQVDMRIYVPQGTQAAYVEPFSHYGVGVNGKSGMNDSDGLRWDGTSGQRSFGSEDETIIQRGASYTCTRIERIGYTIHVEMEVHPEDGYDLFGQED